MCSSGNLPPHLLCLFSNCIAPTLGYGNCSGSDRKALLRVVKTAPDASPVPQSPLSRLARASVAKGPSHPDVMSVKRVINSVNANLNGVHLFTAINAFFFYPFIDGQCYIV